MPTIPHVMTKKAPTIPHILLAEQDPDSFFSRHSVALVGVVVVPEQGEEERAGRCHDGDVRHEPGFVVVFEGGDRFADEGVMRYYADYVVTDACWVGAPDPGGVGEERVEAALAALHKVLKKTDCGYGGFVMAER